VKEKGVEPAEVALRDPAPFSEKVTAVAFPPKVLPGRVKADNPQAVSEADDKESTGPFTQSQETLNTRPVDTHPAEFLTDIV
jgi:hypothetical protein